MPMISFPLYTAVYYSTIEIFPGAQFFFGASANLLMALIFILIMVSDRSANYNVEEAVLPAPEGPVKERSLVMRKDSRWLYDEENNNKIRLATILLSTLNFSIEVPMMEQTWGKPLETIQEEPEEEEAEEEEARRHATNNGGPVEGQISASYDNVAYVNDSKP